MMMCGDGMGAEHMFSKRKCVVRGTFQMQICHERTLEGRTEEVEGVYRLCIYCRTEVAQSKSFCFNLILNPPPTCEMSAGRQKILKYVFNLKLTKLAEI